MRPTTAASQLPPSKISEAEALESFAKFFEWKTLEFWEFRNLRGNFLLQTMNSTPKELTAEEQLMGRLLVTIQELHPEWNTDVLDYDGAPNITKEDIIHHV